MIKVIINADDFGYSTVFNEKILELLEGGFLLSTCVMVNRINDSQMEQVNRLKALRKSKHLDIGLHVEPDFAKKKEFRNDIKRQFEKFVQIFGFSPTHLNLHKVLAIRAQSISRNDVVDLITELSEFGRMTNIPVRNFGINGADIRTTTMPSFYNPEKGFDGIMEYIKTTSDRGSCEIITHPGEYDSKSKSTLNKQRKAQYAWVMKLNKAIKSDSNMKLSSFIEIH